MERRFHGSPIGFHVANDAFGGSKSARSSQRGVAWDVFLDQGSLIGSETSKMTSLWANERIPGFCEIACFPTVGNIGLEKGTWWDSNAVFFSTIIFLLR